MYGISFFSSGLELTGRNQVLGYVSINWRLLADQTTIFHEDCMKLADLHSLAVDYPKSGKPVPIFDIPRRNNQLLPDWYAPETMVDLDTTKYYQSQKAIGRLYRRIELSVVHMQRSETPKPEGARRGRRRAHDDDGLDDVADQMRFLHFDDENQDKVSQAVIRRVEEFMDIEGDLDDFPDISGVFQRYCSALMSICMMHTLSHSRGPMLREEEAVVGTIIANSPQPRKRLDHIRKLREETEVLVREVRSSLEGEGKVSSEERLSRSFHAWRLAVSARHHLFGRKSFALVALGGVFEAIREIEAERERAQRPRARR